MSRPPKRKRPGLGAAGAFTKTDSPSNHAGSAAVVNLVWHYTTGQKFQAIIEANALLRDDQTTPHAFVGDEPGFVWFSSNPNWEQTANKSVIVAGEVVPLDMEETAELCGGLVRLGVRPGNGIVPFRAVRSFRGPIRKALERTAREAGSDPRQWYVSKVPIAPLDEYLETVEVWKSGEWSPVWPGGAG